MRALALYSGGLDSILAARIVMEQGVEVVGVTVVSPFFHYEILDDVPGYVRAAKEKFALDVVVRDSSQQYLEMLRKPTHGFGRNFNPCVDCKIFMMRLAKEMLAEYEASFLISGEVLGQRPMSQRRDTLNVISRDSETKDLLLRPLSAKLLKPTWAEKQGWVERERLLDFNGRGRSRQIALAKELGITDYPAPAGGCTLADPILSRRIKNFYADNFVVKAADMTVTDILLLLVGRQFLLPHGSWFIVGRDMRDNDKLASLAEPGDALVKMVQRPGPLGLLRRAGNSCQTEEQRCQDRDLAAQLVVRYGRKVDGSRPATSVTIRLDGKTETISAAPLDDEIFTSWML